MPNPQLTSLEHELLALEQDFAQGKPIDVAHFITQTKTYTQLKLDETRQLALEEGLRAGLVVKELKETKAVPEIQTPQKEPDETQIMHTSPLPESPDITTPVPKDPPFSQAEQQSTDVAQNYSDTPIINQAPPEPPRYVRNQSSKEAKENRTKHQQPQAPSLVSPPPTLSFPEKPDFLTNFTEHLSEVNLGKYIMGILAAVLAVTGTVLLGILLWPYMTNEAKALLQIVIASSMVYFPYRRILDKPNGSFNGFLTSVTGTGLSIFYVTIIFMGTSWNMIGELPLLWLLISLILGTVFLAHKVTSNTLLVVSYLGNTLTFLLLAFLPVAVNQLYMSLLSFLAITLFLLGYTLKNHWTNLPTKVLSVASSFLIVSFTYLNLDCCLYLLYSTEPNAPHFTTVTSPLYPMYLIMFLYSFCLALLSGKLFSPDLDSDSPLSGINLLTPLALFGSYFYFCAFFEDSPLLILLLLVATIVFHKKRAIPLTLSFPFVLALLPECTQTLLLDQEFLLTYHIFLAIAIACYFFHKQQESSSLLLPCTLYLFAAQMTLILEIETFLPILPLALCLLYLFYEGIAESISSSYEETSVTVAKLCAYLPFALLLAHTFRLYEETYRHYEHYTFIFLLCFTSTLSILNKQKYIWDEKSIFIHSVQLFKHLSFFFVCIFVVDNSRYFPLALGVVALLFVMADAIYTLITGNSTLVLGKLKAIAVLLMATLSLNQATPLGDFAISSSIIILSFGVIAIYLGFRQLEQELRKLGLALAILSVIKMVLIDISDSNSIMRVIAMIFGAILCFGISCVYNKLDEDS